MRKVIRIIIFCALGAALIGTMVYSVFASSQRDAAIQQLQNSYQDNLLQTVAGMRNVESDLSKLMVTTEETTIVQLLSSISLESAACAQALSRLPVIATAIQNTLRFDNQLSSWCSTVLKSYASNGTLPEDFDKTATDYFHACGEINNSLALAEESAANGELDLMALTKNKENKNEGLFGGIDKDLMKYPSVIFDGPFSDGQVQEQPVTKREVVTQEKAQETLKNLGWDATYTEEVKSETALYEFTSGDTSLMVSEEGGLLWLVLNSRAIGDATLTEEQAQQAAEQFVKKLDRGDSQVVWEESYNDSIVFNFVPVVDDIVIYPDMFRVKVALDNGEIVGFEGKSYVMNHKERDLPEATVTYNDASKRLKEGFTVSESRLCIILASDEKLCYEFYGEYDGMSYAIYISATDGKEKACFRIISTDTGEMIL